LADELNLIHDFHQWQEEMLQSFTLILDPGTYRRSSHLKGSSESGNMSDKVNSRSKLYAMERALLGRQISRLAKDVRRTSQMLAQCSRMVEDVRKITEITADDKSRAIFIFTTVTAVFLPLSFVSSYVSMSGGTTGLDWAGLQLLFWEVAIPLTVGVFAFCLVVSQANWFAQVLHQRLLDLGLAWEYMARLIPASDSLPVRWMGHLARLPQNWATERNSDAESESSVGEDGYYVV
jgi:hypothetical protein